VNYPVVTGVFVSGQIGALSASVLRTEKKNQQCAMAERRKAAAPPVAAATAIGIPTRLTAAVSEVIKLQFSNTMWIHCNDQSLRTPQPNCAGGF
jgi:hypothetical protein